METAKNPWKKKAATVRNSGCKAREVISVGAVPSTFRTGI